MIKLRIQLLFIKEKLPIILALVLYILIYLIRYQQGGWEVNLDLFPEFRQSLDQKIASFLPSPQAELLSGIVLGNKKDLPFDLRLALRDTSTLHIVVVSGQNLTLLAGVLLNLSGLIKRKNAIILSIFVIIFYTLLTGGQIPVVRAAIMVSLASFARLLGRAGECVWALIITASLMLLVNPNWLFDLSFQLSFLATFGVIAVAPILEKIIIKLPAVIRVDLAVTIGAQLMVMPLLIQNFHQLSLVSTFANVLVGWTVPFIMIGGVILLILGSVAQVLGEVFGLALNVLLTYFIYIVNFFASLPFAWEYVGEQIWIVWVGYYLVMGGILIILNNVNIKNKNEK